MAASVVVAAQPTDSPELRLTPLVSLPRTRVLAWDRDVLYASRGYKLFRFRMHEPSAPMKPGNATAAYDRQAAGYYAPPQWRRLSSASKLAGRLTRDGFHALAVLSTGHLVAAVPRAIIALAPMEQRFSLSHQVLRGTRPLHFAVSPDDHVFWGEYFDNPSREEVHIFASSDKGEHWEIAYSFAKGSVRHVHNVVYDKWEHCLWILTGDDGAECRILRAACDFSTVDVILSGHQQARAAAIVPTASGLYFSTDTPLETNHIYCLDRRGNVKQLAGLGGSSIYGCRSGNDIFFSTMVEPSMANPERYVSLHGSADGRRWPCLQRWKKDRWPMNWFQYGNAILPDGVGPAGVLAATTVAVDDADCETTIWQTTDATPSV